MPHLQGRKRTELVKDKISKKRGASTFLNTKGRFSSISKVWNAPICDTTQASAAHTKIKNYMVKVSVSIYLYVIILQDILPTYAQNSRVFVVVHLLIQ